jgi:hypothetical protein
MAKTKYIMHHCAYCRKETKMEFVGNQPTSGDNSEVKNWCKCKHSALLSVNPAIQAKKNQSAVPNREDCTPYDKQKTFTIGEYIYYAEWDDMGKVIKKDRMSNGTNSIVVSFEKNGERKLLESLGPEVEEIVENQIL